MQWLGRTSRLGRVFFGPTRIRDRQLQQLRNFDVSSTKKIPQSCAGSHRLDVPESPLEPVDLTNGMRLICEFKDSCVTTVGCFLPAGSLHERPEERGASLFMEHLIFRVSVARKLLKIINLNSPMIENTENQMSKSRRNSRSVGPNRRKVGSSRHARYVSLLRLDSFVRCGDDYTSARRCCTQWNDL